MSYYQKIQASGGKIPRKLKKRIKKIPVGDYCYGSTIGDKDNGTKSCPYQHRVSKLSRDGERQAYCSFVHKVDDFILTDDVKICERYESFFPEFKHPKIDYAALINDKAQGIGVIKWLWEK